MNIWCLGSPGECRAPAADSGALTFSRIGDQVTLGVTERTGAKLGDCSWNFLTWTRFSLQSYVTLTALFHVVCEKLGNK